MIHYGTEKQKHAYLDCLTKKPKSCAYAVTEPGTGSDVGNIKTRAKKLQPHIVMVIITC